MYKILIIERCEDCPHLRHIYNNRYCGDTLKGKRIDLSVKTYPDWCPLDDGPQQVTEPDLEKLGFCLKCGTRPCTCKGKYGEDKAG